MNFCKISVVARAAVAGGHWGGSVIGRGVPDADLLGRDERWSKVGLKVLRIVRVADPSLAFLRG